MAFIQGGPNYDWLERGLGGLGSGLTRGVEGAVRIQAARQAEERARQERMEREERERQDAIQRFAATQAFGLAARGIGPPSASAAAPNPYLDPMTTSAVPGLPSGGGGAERGPVIGGETSVLGQLAAQAQQDRQLDRGVTAARLGKMVQDIPFPPLAMPPSAGDDMGPRMPMDIARTRQREAAMGTAQNVATPLGLDPAQMAEFIGLEGPPPPAKPDHRLEIEAMRIKSREGEGARNRALRERLAAAERAHRKAAMLARDGRDVSIEVERLADGDLDAFNDAVNDEARIRTGGRYNFMTPQQRAGVVEQVRGEMKNAPEWNPAIRGTQFKLWDRASAMDYHRESIAATRSKLGGGGGGGGGATATTGAELNLMQERERYNKAVAAGDNDTAGRIHENMARLVKQTQPGLTDEEAWGIASRRLLGEGGE